MTEMGDLARLVNELAESEAQILAHMHLEIEDGLRAYNFDGPSGTPGISDPTGDIATGANRNQQVAAHIRRWQYYRRAMLDAATSLNALRARYAAPQINRESIPEPHRWCENCVQWGRLAPAVPRGNFCWWCRDFKTTAGYYPGRLLVEARPHAV